MLNKPIKLIPEKGGKVYFSSDFHYNHQRDFIWKPRGFSTYEAHDKWLEQQCENLNKEDILIYLGDYSLNSSFEQTFKLVSKTKAQIYYIFGNHESVMGRFYKDEVRKHIGENITIFPFSIGAELDPLTRKYIYAGRAGIHKAFITFFGEEETFQYNGNFFYCRHMAPLIWDKMKYDNQFALCGHSHSNCPKINIHTKEGRILDVGVDNAQKYNGSAFLTAEEVVEIMKQKTIVLHDHHGEDHVH